MSIFVTLVGIVACFLFAAGHASSAAQAFDEKRWDVFGCDFTMACCFIIGIALLLQMRFGI